MPRPIGNGPGWGGPAMGAGWGGAKKGASMSRITSDAIGEAIRAMSRDPEHMAQKHELAAEMLAIQIDAARNSEAEAMRIMAADKVQDRLLGKPTTQVDNRISGGEGGAIGFTWLPPVD
jgi:hypothetical protein